MTFTLPPQPSGKSMLVVFLLFMCVWLPFMAASLTAKVCMNPKYDEEKRLRYCNFSLRVAGYSIGSLEGHKMSGLYMERGILHANIGETELAREDMQKALELASFGKPHERLMELANPPRPNPIILNPPKSEPWVPKLLVRAEQKHVSAHAKQIWLQIISETMEKH